MESDKILNRCDALEDGGQVPEAIQLLNEAISQFPDEAMLWLRRGLLNSRYFSLQEGIGDLLKAREMEPDNDAVHRNLCLAYLKASELDAAIACARQAIELAPDNADSHECMGLCMLQREDFLAARKCFKIALSAEPLQARYLSGMGRTLTGLGKSDEALACYQQVADIAPKASVYIRMARLSLDKGKIEDTMHYLEMAKTFPLIRGQRILIEGYTRLAINHRPQKLRKLE